MPLNIGYLKADRTVKGDEVFTPFYAVEPIIKYLKPHWVIWLPFDDYWSAFTQLLKERGFKVYNTHIDLGQDFLTYTPDFDYDVIISNPPFSKKDAILARLAELNKPYAMLLPIQTLQGQKRFSYFKDIEMLAFDKRIGYYTDFNFGSIKEGTAFASVYLCKGILPHRLILEELIKYDRPL